MADNISLQIEKTAKKCGSYIEAVLDFAERNNIVDLEELKDILSSNITKKIWQEAVDHNFIRGEKKDNIFDFIS